MCGAFKNHLLTENPRKRCEHPAHCSPESCPEPSKNAAFPSPEAAPLLNKERLIYKVVLIWESLVVLFPLKKNSFATFFFFHLFKTLPCVLGGFIKLLENKFSCAFSSQNTHTQNLLPKTREKLLCLICQPLTLAIGFCFFHKTFYPIKSYFQSFDDKMFMHFVQQ